MNGLRTFLLRVVGVALVKHLATKAADSAFTLGFLSPSAARRSSVIASNVVYKEKNLNAIQNPANPGSAPRIAVHATAH